jgi:hypothetical protein
MNNNLDWHDQQTRQTRRPRRLEEASSAEVGFPLAWILIGALAGLLVIGLVGLGVVNILRKQAVVTPTPLTATSLAPTQELLEAAPPTPASTPTIPPVVTLEPTITPTPTETPVPVAPTELTVGGYAQVIGTEGAGLSLRAGPGTNNARLSVVQEEEAVLLLEGPRADENQENYTWWFVRKADGEEGWTVQDYLQPTLPPEQQPTQ